MATSKRAAAVLKDEHVSVKQKLSALWVVLMFLYTYADILGFYTPNTLAELMSGQAGGIQLTEVFLSVMAIWMALPSLMIFFALILKAKANRWVNLIIGVVSMVALIGTFFVGEFSMRYALQAAVEAVVIALIVWYAWKWPIEE